MAGDWWYVALGALLVLALVAVPVVRGIRRNDDAGPLPAGPEDRPLPAVVANPTKIEPGARERITAVCTGLGWAEPLWLETTIEDPGTGQARLAVEKGADVVLACGGDGTVRSVAQALAGTGVALGLVPAGTGNLLARTLGTPPDLVSAVRVALTGDDRVIDVGRVRIGGTADDTGPDDTGPDDTGPDDTGPDDTGPDDTGPADPPESGGTSGHGDSDEADEADEADEQVFLVMAGTGFDATIMESTPEALKVRVGPLAYVISGIRAMRGRRTRVTLTFDDGAPLRRRSRTVVVGNSGTLLGGLVLMPAATIDDGVLDVVNLAPKGLAGWIAVAGRLISRKRGGHPRVEHWQARSIVIAADVPQPSQIDGDPIGDVALLRLRVDPGALVVRVPGHVPTAVSGAGPLPG